MRDGKSKREWARCMRDDEASQGKGYGEIEGDIAPREETSLPLSWATRKGVEGGSMSQEGHLYTRELR